MIMEIDRRSEIVLWMVCSSFVDANGVWNPRSNYLTS